MTQYKTISGREANELDLVPITRGYFEAEYEMLDKAISTLEGKIYVLVKTSEGIIIARPRRDVNTFRNEH